MFMITYNIKKYKKRVVCKLEQFKGEGKPVGF